MSSVAAVMNPAQPSPADARRIIFSSSIGNALEWYDFLIYGFFAATIGKLFFPTDSEQISLLLAVGSFGISFLMRPIGAIVLGIYADRQGRKASLTLSILLMVLGTLTIAVMPTYHSIGLVAPLLVILARLVQGFAVGGEFGSATAFMSEQSKNRRGFYASWQFATQGMATVMASAIGGTIAASLTQDQIESWGWRLPFMLGLVIGPVGYYIRRHLHETPEFVEAQKKPAPSAASDFGNQWGNLLLCRP
jgi:MHS family proline/betaine transporter-like MFS transporter